jgi:hypothetical protein
MRRALARSITFTLALVCGGALGGRPAPAQAAPLEEPAAAPAPTPPPAVAAATSRPTVEYALGTRLRGVFVPTWFLEAFMQHAHPLNSIAWGAEFTRRKGNLDIVVALDVGWYGHIAPANWTGSDKDLGFPLDTYWTEFSKLVFTSIDVNWIWHYDFTEWIALRYGGGVGLGFVSGNIYRGLSGPPSGCTKATVDDLTVCNRSYLGAPARFAEDLSSYRVLPVVSVLLGLRFRVHRHAVITLEGGFHDAFFFGGGGQYIF